MEAKKTAAARKAFEVNKKMQMAVTVANTAAAIMGVMASPETVSTTQKFIMGAIVAAMGAAGIPSPELIGQVNYFTNDFDTETSGYDIIAVYSTELFGTNADISAAWNHTETEVTNSGAVTGASKVHRLEEVQQPSCSIFKKSTQC